MARRYKMKTLDDGAVVRANPRQPYQGSEIRDASGQPALGSPIVERNVSTDTGSVPVHPIDPRVLDGTHPHRFMLDPQGRPLMAEGQILNLPHLRNLDAQASVSGPFRADGAAVDATHLIARSLGGPGGFENLVPAADTMNRKEIAAFEDKVRGLAADPHRQIFMQVYVKYGGDHSMPTELNFLVFEKKGDQVVQLEAQPFYPSH